MTSFCHFENIFVLGLAETFKYVFEILSIQTNILDPLVDIDCNLSFVNSVWIVSTVSNTIHQFLV